MSILTTTLYPLRFESIYKEKLWGAENPRSTGQGLWELSELWRDLGNLGCTWECVRSGRRAPCCRSLRELIEEFKGRW